MGSVGLEQAPAVGNSSEQSGFQLLRRITEPAVEDRLPALGVSALAVCLIASADYLINPNVSIGYLYIIPILLSAGFLPRWQIIVAAGVCALLRERLGPFSNDGFVWTREAFVFVSFSGAGLLTRQVIRSRRRAEDYSARLEAEIQLRNDAEEQLRILVESNPAAIFTIGSDRTILLANRSALRLLGLTAATAVGRRLDEFLPDLGRVPIDSERRFFRTHMECFGRRADGTLLAVDVWFSTYETSRGRRLTAIVLDSTEETREREGLGLDSLMNTSRLLVGAVLHEIRNLSAAASVAYENLKTNGASIDSEDFRALGSMVEGLEQVASSELAPLSGRVSAVADLGAVLEDLQLVVEPAVSEADALLELDVDPELHLRIDRHSLLQVLLNLFRNSIRALQDAEVRRINIETVLEDGEVLIRFRDTGAGVADPASLFQAFRSSSAASGLGLYVSRAIVRSFGGELDYERVSQGASFTIRLLRAPARTGERRDRNEPSIDPSADHRRPQPLSPGLGPAA